MDRYLKLSFDNVKGRNCKDCKLSIANKEDNYCVALDNNAICSKDGCRKDCPLLDNVAELPVIEANNERYKDITTYKKYLFADYTRNDYRDLLKTKKIEEIEQTYKTIDKMIENMRILHEGLLQKQAACRDILESEGCHIEEGIINE